MGLLLKLIVGWNALHLPFLHKELQTSHPNVASVLKGNTSENVFPECLLDVNRKLRKDVLIGKVL